MLIFQNHTFNFNKMISATLLLIGKILLMLLIIGGMVMILLGIGHLFHTDDLNTSEDDLTLKDEVESSEEVVGEKSVFFNFIVRRTENNENPKQDNPS